MKNNFLVLLMFLVLSAGCGSDEGSNNIPISGPFNGNLNEADVSDDGRPLTIPALREWQAAEKEPFRLQAGARLVVGNNELLPVAEVFVEDMKAMLGGSMPVAVDVTPATGDIQFVLGEVDERLGSEGYRLTIGESIRISAVDPRGVFYGTRSLLQMFGQSLFIPAGEALDWPRFEKRGLMVDCGRKYFSAAWFHRHVRELAWLKMNELHLHFSDNEGFRIESETHPEIVSEQHLTKAEVAEIVALAGRYFIQVIPELDMPGHMTHILTPHPEYQLTDVFGQSDAARLDITNTEAVTFARDLIVEYLPLFPGVEWHTGGDEFIAIYDYPRYPNLQEHAQAEYGDNANGKDAVHDFLNDTVDMLADNGKLTRAWQDDLAGGSEVVINPDIIVEWWTNYSPLGDQTLVPKPQDLLDAGHKIINSGWFPTYYVIGGAFGLGAPVPAIAQMKDAYESWEVYEFYGPLFSPDAGGNTAYFPPDVVDPEEPNLLGSKLNIWSDGADAETEDEVAENIAPRLRVIAQKTWSSQRLTESYADFEPVMSSIGSAPGY